MFILKMFSRLFNYLHSHNELWHHSWPLNAWRCWQITQPEKTHKREGVDIQLSAHPTTLMTIRESCKLH